MGHRFQVLVPFLIQSFVCQNQAHDPGTVGGGVRNHGPLGFGNLGLDLILDLGRLGDDRQVTGTFGIQAKVLGEGLGHKQFKTVIDKVPDRERVLVQIPRGKALVRAVKEGEMLLGRHDISNLAPLVRCGVNPRGIMGTGVEEEDGS